MDFVCKFCNKSFSSGKSLGGHMRSHLAVISTQKREEDNIVNMGYEGVEKPNEKKHGELRKDHVCKECGKGFDSLRAVAGHMRCHSMKGKEENVCNECGRGFDSRRALFGHMKSHSKRKRISADQFEKSQFPAPKKRLRTRYKVTPNPSCSKLIEFSSIAERDEIEELALCLMMLSRGERDCGVPKSICEYESHGIENFNVLDVSVIESHSCDTIKKHRQGHESGIELGDAVIENGINLNAPESGIELVDADIENSVEQENELKRGKDYECSICFKVFASGQALGGHKRAHYVALTEEATLIKQDVPDDKIHIFDLNLPAAMEEGASDDVGLEPWWPKSKMITHS